MSDSTNLVDFEHLQQYHNALNDDINTKLYGKSDSDHQHSLIHCRVSNSATHVSVEDYTRLAGYRRCDARANASGTVTLNCTNYSMFYLDLVGETTIILDNPKTTVTVNTSGDNIDKYMNMSDYATKAREIKVILKNPGSKTIHWPSNVVWMDGDPVYSGTGNDNKVDVADLFTADGSIWFAHLLKNFSV